MAEGKIAKLMDRNYGFIEREGETKDLFFHANSLKDVRFNDLKEGDPVTFDVENGMKGPQAVNVARA